MLVLNSFSEYANLAAVTDNNSDKSRNENNAHYIFGLWTELQELKDATDVVNRDEEIGDMLWYLSRYVFENHFEYVGEILENHFLNHKSNEISSFTLSMRVPNIGKYLAEITDIEKKELAYGKDRDMRMLNSFLNGLIDELMRITSKSMKLICEANIAKLQSRYGEKFDAHLAINRNINKERFILEQKLA